MSEQQAEAQQALDDLYNEGLLPFKLTAYRLASIGLEEYIVFFYDSRLHSLDLSWCEGESIKDVVRVAVLDRVKRLNNH